jgi:hypothetical protein
MKIVAFVVFSDVLTSTSLQQSSSASSTSKPTERQSTSTPSQTGTSEVTINLKNPNLVATSSPSKVEVTFSPSATLHPNDKFWRTPEPSMQVTSAPTFLLRSPEPTTKSPSAQPSEAKEQIVTTFPKIDYVLLTTDGDLSGDAVENVETSVQTFLSAELAAYYGSSFSALSIAAAETQAVARDVDLKKKKGAENLIRRRQLSSVTGTKVVFEGVIYFEGEAPTESDLTDALVSIGEESNNYLVSNITSTGDSELQDIVVVLVEISSDESSAPSSKPSVWIEDFVRTPDGIVESVETAPTSEARTSIIIVSICGIAALTMLLFVYATRSKTRDVEERVEEEVMPSSKSPRASQHMLPIEIDVESANATHESHNDNESGYYLNDNEASTIISSVTDWNDYVTVDSRRVTTKSRVDVVNGSRSHEDVVATWFDTPDGTRKTAAELNNIGTRTLEKNNESVVPKTWSLTSSGQNVPTRFSLGAASASSARRGDDSDSDDSSTCHDGGFPSLQGSFPTAKQTHVNSRDFQVRGSNCGAEAIYKDVDSSFDYSARSAYSAVGSGYDWSHIGTVDDVPPEYGRFCASPVSRQSASAESAPGISTAPSHDTKDTSTSLNRFINDLVWLEKKITDENDALKVREAVELTLKESDIQGADSYSYQCDSFSPRSNSSIEEDATTISSRQASNAMSIVCRDCFVPPGDLRIDVVSTVDGPMINSVGEELLGHLGKGDLIIAVDDSDTRALSAEEFLAMISAKSSLERKLTVLQFGSNTSMC